MQNNEQFTRMKIVDYIYSTITGKELVNVVFSLLSLSTDISVSVQS